jgi:hypothetical protein
MDEVWFYGYGEDELSCAVMRRLFSFHNECRPKGRQLVYRPGFPDNKRGFGNIKKLSPKLKNMAMCPGLNVFVLTDLDRGDCAPALIQEWFPPNGELPDSLLFRVAEREVEVWLMADRDRLAFFLEISPQSFSADPDSLVDPKEHLLNVIRAKGRKRYHRDMLPHGNAHVGTEYNPKLCEFVQRYWSIKTAERKSLSLRRALDALRRFD